MPRHTVALAIPHAPWHPERVGSYRRLVETLHESCPTAVQARTVISDGPRHCSVWAVDAWTWAVSTDATHFLLLQDDAVVAPNFWEHLFAILEAVPGSPIGFQAIHPVGPELAKVGIHWYTTLDMMPGVAWACPMPMLREFLQFEGRESTMNEDTIFALFCAAKGYRIHHPVPTIVDHDSTLTSLYGHDAHTHRNPCVTWRDAPLPASWALPDDVPHLGRFYQATPYNYVRYVKDWTDADADRIQGDIVQWGLK